MVEYNMNEIEASPEADPIEPTTPVDQEQSEVDIKAMYSFNIITSPNSLYTLEHRRQTPGEKKLIYSVRFSPDNNKFLAIGFVYNEIRIF